MPDKTHVLILGGGFGGLYAALHLDKTIARDQDIEVTLVSRDNYSLFTPMLSELCRKWVGRERRMVRSYA